MLGKPISFTYVLNFGWNGRIFIGISPNLLVEISLVGQVIAKSITLLFSNLFIIGFGQNLFQTLVKPFVREFEWKLWRLGGEKPHDCTCFMVVQNSGLEGSFAPCYLLASKSLVWKSFEHNLADFTCQNLEQQLYVELEWIS